MLHIENRILQAGLTVEKFTVEGVDVERRLPLRGVIERVKVEVVPMRWLLWKGLLLPQSLLWELVLKRLQCRELALKGLPLTDLLLTVLALKGFSEGVAVEDVIVDSYC